MDPTQATTGPAAPSRRSAGLAFLREAARAFRTTGAVSPSSRHLAASLAAPLAAPLTRPSDGRSAAVLEVGAGTGKVTRTLAGLLGPSDRLDAVEINPRFVRVLGDSLRTDPGLAAVAEQIRIIPESITDMDLREGSYDVIVSCLPFANFDPGTVRSILERYMTALVPGGSLTYFSYLGTLASRTLVSSRTEVARHRAVSALLSEFENGYGDGRHVVWRNLPPARVHLLKAPGQHAARAQDRARTIPGDPG